MRWLKTLGNFRIFPISLKAGKIHVLSDMFSRAPHATVHILEVLKIDLGDVTNGHGDDKFYSAVLNCMKGRKISDETMRRKIEKLLHLFHLEEGELLYERKICVHRKTNLTVLRLAHDAKTLGHFGYLDALSRLRSYHWKSNSSNVENYVQRCLICQQKKDCMVKKLIDSISLEVPERR